MAGADNTRLEFTPEEHKKMNDVLKKSGADLTKLTGKPVVPPFTENKGETIRPNPVEAEIRKAVEELSPSQKLQRIEKSNQKPENQYDAQIGKAPTSGPNSPKI